jgi:hypothetical protein
MEATKMAPCRQYGRVEWNMPMVPEIQLAHASNLATKRMEDIIEKQVIKIWGKK